MKTKHFALAAITASLATVSTTHAAATIAWVGVNTNIDSTADDGATIGWNSTGNAKSLDGDGDNKLGTVGWHYSHTSGGGGLVGRKALPTSITTTNSTAPNSNNDAAQLADAPAAGVLTGNPATEASISTWWRNNTSSLTVNVISFTIVNATTFTNGLRLGVLFDTTSAPVKTGSQTYTLTQTVGGSGTVTSSTLSFADDGMDAAFFDIKSLTSGDAFQLSMTNTTGSYAHASGITFDVIPEPSAALLGSLGLLALLRRRRA